MTIFTKEDKLTSAIHSNYDLLPVINRFGILPGFRDKSIKVICEEKNINADFFLAIINTFHNSDYFPEKELMSFSPILIIDYLKKTHQYYLDYTLPKLENILDNLLNGCPHYCDEMKMIEAFYKKYKNELLIHLQYEDTNVFPYVINLINTQNKSGYSIHEFEKEHTNIDEKLKDLQNLIIKYIEPSYNVNDCNDFLMSLNRFEKDLKDHARIEDKILVQQVIELENSLDNE